MNSAIWFYKALLIYQSFYLLHYALDRGQNDSYKKASLNLAHLNLVNVLAIPWLNFPFHRTIEIRAEISRLLKKNRLEKLVSPVKRSTYLHASTKQNFAWRCFFEVNRIPIIFSPELDDETGRSILEKVWLQKFCINFFIKVF